MRSIAALGDVTDMRCWSGIPYYFSKAASAAGFATIPWQLDLSKLRGPRLAWNLGRLLRGHRPGGFQYSAAFRRIAHKQIPRHYFATEVITFHSHFPAADVVVEAGGRLNHYVDATFISLSSGKGLVPRLPPDVVERARQEERANYAVSDRVIAMARWTAESLVQDCGVNPAKVTTILPGANFEVDDEIWLNRPRQRGRPGRDRDFVLGFIGMDWRRKGLPFLVGVRDELGRRGYKVLVLAMGTASNEIKQHQGVRHVGVIDKQRETQQFLAFLTQCDVGCLFSSNEALGISTLEFLRAGVPVAGFAHQGLADTIPPDAGFRFPLMATLSDVADAFDNYLSDVSRQERFCDNARKWSPLVTWERCLREVEEFWTTNAIVQPVLPGEGLR